MSGQQRNRLVEMQSLLTLFFKIYTQIFAYFHSNDTALLNFPRRLPIFFNILYAPYRFCIHGYVSEVSSRCL